jgi:hypothetical protein
MSTLPATVSPGIDGSTAFCTVIMLAIADGMLSKRDDRPSGLTTLRPSNDRVVQ